MTRKVHTSTYTNNTGFTIMRSTMTKIYTNRIKIFFSIFLAISCNNVFSKTNTTDKDNKAPAIDSSQPVSSGRYMGVTPGSVNNRGIWVIDTETSKVKYCEIVTVGKIKCSLWGH